MGLLLIKLFLGLGIAGWGVGALRYYRKGIGLEFGRGGLTLVPINKASNLQKTFMLVQALLFIIAGIAVFFVKL